MSEGAELVGVSKKMTQVAKELLTHYTLLGLPQAQLRSMCEFPYFSLLVFAYIPLNRG